MFYLLVVLIAITLIGIVAGATSNYIGAAFNDGSAEAQASTLISGGSQIAAAKTLHDTQNPGSAASSIAALTGASPAYLDQAPNAPTGSFSVTVNTSPSPDVTLARINNGPVGNGVCTQVNDKAGVSTPTASNASTTSVQYGCDANGFFYRL